MEHKSENRICQNCKKDFTIEPEDFNFYEKIKVPAPTFCPECRLVRRLCWRNERSLYKRTCDMCHRDIISMYDKDVVFPVFCPECWKSDSWNPSDYALDYDFDKAFFEQFKEMFNLVPRKSLWQDFVIDSDYSNYVRNVKNVYLGYSVISGCENIYYASQVDNSKNIFDSFNTTSSELIYENIGGTKNYNCQYSYWSSSCIDSNFIYDCVNCVNCFGCVNLRNKKYCIWNEQYSKEEYFKKIREVNVGSYKFTQKIFNEFWNFTLHFPKRYAQITNCLNSIGDELRNCKNATQAFNCYDCENIKYAYRCPTSKDCMDVCHTNRVSLAYEHSLAGSDDSQNIKFVANGGSALNEVEYVDFCQSSSNLFGCIGLKNKKYCILNKEYKKEEYFETLEKIKKHMCDMPYIDSKERVYTYGEFFPYEFSPFGYNETVINDYLSLSKEEITKRGYNWKDKIENKYIITKKADELPDDIKDVEDSILDETIECAITKKAFKITKFELQFYRKMNIPIPRLHQDERYKNRLKLRNPMKLWHRNCMCNKTNHFHGVGKCEVEFETSYAPDRPEIVYCERCYQQEVY